MRRALIVIALTVALLVVAAAPALAVTPANEGAGKMYGEHIRSEAHAGTLGKEVHPGLHRGMHGWVIP